jgi:hypothetical protein
MTETMSARAAWESFYVIVGSSGGALIGLQFVVITLLADRRHRTTPGGLNAFATPTVVHLTGALVVAAIMSAPWPLPAAFFVAVAATGLAGLAYAAVVVVRTLRQRAYEPVWEDWLWYTVLPGACYAALAITAFLRTVAPAPMFVIGAAALGLLLIGIHNAWDTVTHIVLTDSEGDGQNS